MTSQVTEILNTLNYEAQYLTGKKVCHVLDFFGKQAMKEENPVSNAKSLISPFDN